LATKGLVFADGHGLKGPTGKGRETRKMNLHQAIRDALRTVLVSNPKSFVFGEDVKAHGVL
jgi:2-oxoisovalerate dehydrogenase E1 component beta subunit